MTVEKFAEVFGVEKPVAYGMLRFLAEKGLVFTSKLARPAGVKGKPATIYHIDAKAGARLAELFTKQLAGVELIPFPLIAEMEAQQAPAPAPTQA